MESQYRLNIFFLEFMCLCDLCFCKRYGAQLCRVHCQFAACKSHRRMIEILIKYKI
jgi:hypothetical protein